MTILDLLFKRIQVIGLEFFAAPTPMAADFKKSIVTLGTDEIATLVARTDSELQLHGQLLAFFEKHREIILTGNEIRTCKRPLTDVEWVTFLNGEFNGKKWKSSRFKGMMVEYVVVAVFG